MLVLILSITYLLVIVFMAIGVLFNWHKDDYVLTIAKTAPHLLSMVFTVSILLWPLTVIFWITLPKEDK